MSSDRLIDAVRDAVIGEGEAIATPFGLRRVTYADYAASGRSVTFIEDFIRETVLPLYANTHTESSGTGLQTTRFREDARANVRPSDGREGTSVTWIPRAAGSVDIGSDASL